MLAKNEADAAEALFNLLVEGGVGQKGEGTGTAIVAAACVAGAQLMRGTGIDFGEYTPGAYILVDALNDQGIELLNFIDAQLGELAPISIHPWRLPALEGTGPTRSLLELTAAYEGRFVALCDRKGVPLRRRPEVAAATAALIIHRASPVLDAATGKSIVAQALVPACKTVPPPLAK